MTDLNDEMYDNRFMVLETEAMQIRKLLFGSLLLAKDSWKEELSGTQEGVRVLQLIEAAAEDFIDLSITDPVEKLDNVLTVINRRARAIVVVLDYIAHKKQ